MEPVLSRFVDRCVSLAKESVVGRPEPAFAPGRGGYASWVIICLHCYKHRENETYRSLVDKLKLMPEIRQKLSLSRGELPHPSTICNAMDRLSMAICRRLLQRTVSLHDLGSITAIDASGFDRVATNSRYARKTNYSIRSLKTTLLVDCKSSAILDVHCAAGKPSDHPIGEQVLKRNLERIGVVTADKGYDNHSIRNMLRENDVRSLIRHREFGSLHRAWNARMDDDVYHRRQISEAVFRVLNQRYGSSISARIWYRQFREITLKAAVKNIDDTLRPSYA